MYEQLTPQGPAPGLPHRSLDAVDILLAPTRSAPPGHWMKFRRPPRQGDHLIHREATEWVLQLPEALRPASTCARYPRIVNRIVEVWLRGDQCQYLFDHLLSDRRPARRGFPLSVREELRVLAAFRLRGVVPASQE